MKPSLDPSERAAEREKPSFHLTVILPVFNVETHIRATLKSVLASLRPDIELILVDDGSTDSSVGTAEDELRRAGIEYVLIRQRNSGVSSARNAGLKIARGEYILFLDGDDCISEKLYPTVIPIMEELRYDMICWGFERVDARRAVAATMAPVSGPTQQSMSGLEALRRVAEEGDMPMWTGSAAYRKSFLAKHALSFTEGCVSGEDQELIYKAVGSARSVALLEAPLAFWVQRSGSITATFNIRRFDAVEALRRAFEYLEKSPEPGVRAIVERVRARTTRGHYFYNLHSCVLASTASERRFLFREIESVYPGMTSQIRTELNASSTLAWQLRIFLRSPDAYLRYVLLRGKAYSFLALVRGRA